MEKTILIIAGIFLSLSAMAMKPMDETDLSKITCRSGVSIMVDVTMNIHFGTIAWGDPDGYSGAQTNHQAGGSSAVYGGTSESMTGDPSMMPITVRVDPNTMALTSNGTEMYIYKDVFNHTVLLKP